MEVRFSLVLIFAVIISPLICPVRGQDFSFTEVPANVSVTVDESFSLTCEAALVSDPSLALSYMWEKNGTLLANTSRLTIQSATLDDDGIYFCIVSTGTLQDSRSVTVIVMEIPGGLSAEVLTIIVVSVVVGILALFLLGLVIFAWLSVCLHKGHIWEKALPCCYNSKVRSGRRKSLPGQQEEALIRKTQRSKSLGHLFAYSGRSSRKNSMAQDEDPYDRHLSHSTELLLSGAEHSGDQLHPSLEETLDHDLHLDEHLFESSKALSDDNLRGGILKIASLDQQIKPIPIDDLSRHHRVKSDPYTLFKPLLSVATSQHTSVNSSFSDLGEDCSDTHSQTSSLFKSVRFDVSDSGVDSGEVTGTSTPYRSKPEKRRASAPDIKCVRNVHQRRGSAPEEYYSEAVLGEGDSEGVLGEGDSEGVLGEGADVQHVDETENTNTGIQLPHTDVHHGNPTDNTDPPQSEDHKVASPVSVVESWSTIQSEVSNSEDVTSPTHPHTSHSRVTEIKLRFQSEFKGQEEPQTRLRTHSISKLVTETTEQLLKRKDEKDLNPELNVSKEPGKLKGFTNELSMLSSGETKTKPVQPSKAERKTKGDKETAPTLESENTPLTVDEQQQAYNYSRVQATDDQGPHDEVDPMERFERERQSAFALPLFMCPVTMSPWQPTYTSDKDQRDEPDQPEPDSGSDSDDDLVQPLRAQTVKGNISPFGKGFLSNKLKGDITRSMVGGSEVFVGSMKTAPVIKKGVARRLTSIPEESPQGSSHNLHVTNTI